MTWRLILEEYDLDLRYKQDTKNIAIDALSRLDIVYTYILSIAIINC